MDHYEEDSEAIRKENKILLEEFRQYLVGSKLSEKVISNHISNIDFYINEYLLYEEAIEAKDGIGSVSMFLGYWFIKKAMWASQSSVKSNATTLKKFYTFMHTKGFVSEDELGELKLVIKEGMPEWLETLKRYDNPTVDNVW